MKGWDLVRLLGLMSRRFGTLWVRVFREGFVSHGVSAEARRTVDKGLIPIDGV